jgi:hypothetical protein
MSDEFVYAHAFSEMGPDFAVRYRIIKCTKTRIYVHRQLGAQVERDPRCFTLDRVAFERDGKAWCSSRAETYYATEEQALRLGR